MLAQRGDTAARDTLLGQVRTMVHRYCRARLGRLPGSEHAADDVAQEVCIAVLSALPRYRDQGRPFEAWLFGIARRRLASHYRATRRHERDVVIDHPIRDEFLAFEVRDILDRLSAEHRTALELRFLVGLSGEEAAAAMARWGSSASRNRAG